MSLYVDQLNKVTINGVELAACKYKGIPFFTQSSTFSDGRKINPNEFPGSDTPIYEDLGRAGNVMQIPGYFLDNGSVSSALEQYEAASRQWNELGGIGTLTHPQRGILQARSGSVSITDDTESAIVKFTIVFYIERTEAKTQKSINYENKILNKNEVVISSVSENFNNTFSANNQPQSVYDFSLEASRDVLAGIEESKNGVRQSASYLNKITQLAQNLELSILDTVSLGNQLIDLVTLKPLREFNSILLQDGLNLADISSTPVSTGIIEDVNTIQKKANSEALNQLVTVCGLTVISENALYVDIESTADASVIIEDVKLAFNTLMYDSLSFELFDDVQELLTLTIDSLELRAKELPAVRNYEIRETTTVFNVSQNLYNDYEEAQQIIDRNSIDNPFFIPSNSELEVLV